MTGERGGKRCVVFGANGFIGSHLCEGLIARGHDVLAFDRAEAADRPERRGGGRLERRCGDFFDQGAVAEAVRGADWVFHLVSTTLPATSNQNVVGDAEANLLGALRLFEACVKAGVKRVVFASSGGTVYGPVEHLPIAEDTPCEPIVSYGVTKLAVEKYGRLYDRQFGLPVISLRIANPYGPRQQGVQQGVIAAFLRRLREGKSISVWGDGNVVRDYLYIDDVVDAFILAAEYGGDERVFNIGSGEGLSLNDLVARLPKVIGHEFGVESAAGRREDVPAVVLDISRAERELGWRPRVGLDEGLRRTWRAMDGNEGEV